MGSKARIAKYILPIILKDRKEGQWYVEPFCGGCNSLDKVTGNRVGCDSNEYLIALFDALGKGWLPPDVVSEEEYIRVKNSKDEDKALTGFVGFAFSFGGKWFGGYRRDIAGTSDDMDLKIENEATQSRRSYSDICKQADNLNGVKFLHKSYSDLKLNKPCIIYCDPPYAGSTGYKDKFNHVEFWEWCRRMKKEGHTIFISEYNAPEDFTCVWSGEQMTTVSQGKGKKAIEKLFTI